MSLSPLSERDFATNARWLAGRTLGVLLTPVMLAGALTVIATSPAAASTCVSSAGTQPANPSSTVNVLTGVSVLSQCDSWAVGYYLNGTSYQTLIEHWNGSNWTQVPSPNPSSSDNQLNSIAATSATNAWAAGYYYNGQAEQTLIEHWDGTSWTQVASPSPAGTVENNYLYGVTATSAGNAWAIGAYLNTFNGSTWDTLIEHWNGKNWQQVASPNPSSSQNWLNGVADTSGSNAWAVGYYVSGGADQTLTEHWNGKAWQQVPSPNPGGSTNLNSLSSVTATSAGNAWTVGSYYNGQADQTLIEQWNGSSWTQVPSPDPAGSSSSFLRGVTATSASNAWAVGNYSIGSEDQTLIEQWNGTSWTQVPSPDPGLLTDVLSAVSATATTDMWAVGDFSNGAGTATETLGVQ